MWLGWVLASTDRSVCDNIDPTGTIRSAPLAVARPAQRPQPLHDISNPLFHHFRILGILGERAVTFDHGDQQSSGLSGFIVVVCSWVIFFLGMAALDTLLDSRSFSGRHPERSLWATIAYRLWKLPPHI
jgi:hypothetical protein